MNYEFVNCDGKAWPRYAILGNIVAGCAMRFTYEIGPNGTRGYWRDSDYWGLTCEEKDGKIVCDGRLQGTENLKGIEMTPCTETEWENDNLARHIPRVPSCILKIPNDILEMLRERQGLFWNDESKDEEIKAMPPVAMVRECAGWKLGDPSWADDIARWMRMTGAKPEDFDNEDGFDNEDDFDNDNQ